jgi:adenosine deaminase
MTAIPKQLISELPKTDLHCHLDGSLRLSTLIELAKQKSIMLPSYTEEGLRKLVFKDRYDDLIEYLQGFGYTTSVMQTPEALERISYELAVDSFAEGVRYIEPRFAPQLHINPSMTIKEVLWSVNRGLECAKKEINGKKEIRTGKEPPFEYGIIGCALRMFTQNTSSYYRSLFNLHPDMPPQERFGLASLDLVRALIKLRDEDGIPIVGVDLAGAEKGYPAEDHRQAYQTAHRNFLKKTVHAGEAYGPASIFQAVTECYADRIGHGTHLFDVEMVDFADGKERERYVRALSEYIADRRITIEICLTSNMQTMPAIAGIKQHPFRKMLEHRLSTTFCTDNRLISNTTVTNEIETAVSNFDITPARLKDIIIYGFKRSFYPGNYAEKRKYVRKIIDFYESLEFSRRE